MLRIDPGACFLGALLLLTLPLPWLAAAAGGAAVHELCHLAAVKALGGQVEGVTVGLGGLQIQARLLRPWHRWVSSAAGPAGSFALLGLLRSCPRLALWGAAQGVVNLLPLTGLDGGQLLAAALAGCRNPERRQRQVELAVILGLLGLALWAGTALRLGLWPVLLALWAAGKTAFGKKPCKPPHFQVQ